MKVVFDNLAIGWETKGKLIKGVYGGESERLIKELGNFVEDGMLIADVGCGTGKVTKALLSLDKDINIVAVDKSINMLHKLREETREPSNLEIMESDVETMWHSEKFDLILMQQLIHHLPNPTKALANAKRLLKSGGKIILLVIGDEHMNELFLFDEKKRFIW